MTSLNRICHNIGLEKYLKKIKNNCKDCWYHAGYCDNFPDDTNMNQVKWVIDEKKTCVNCAFKKHGLKYGFGYIRVSNKPKKIMNKDEIRLLILSKSKYVKYTRAQLDNFLSS
tara:strand:+ start:651 stop:989 length:339 start_codon:yes stop_codon:yes gene_type:complete